MYHESGKNYEIKAVYSAGVKRVPTISYGIIIIIIIGGAGGQANEMNCKTEGWMDGSVCLLWTDDDDGDDDNSDA